MDTDIWEKIKSGEYKGLSFGGATKANRVPKVMKDGDVAYALTDLEHYEVAVCKDPAVPLALITEFNSVAKAMVDSEPRGDGKELIKGEDWSNADIPTATVTNTVSQSTQTAKPIKTDKKVGVPENEGGLKINVTPLEGGIADTQHKKNDTPASTGTGGGVRAHIDDASNQDNPKDQTAQVSEKIETLHKSDINKVIGAILAGAQRVKSSQSFASGDAPPKKPKGTVTAFGDDDKKDKPSGELPHWKTPKSDKGKPERAGKKKQPLLSNSWEALRQEWKSMVEKKDSWDKEEKRGRKQRYTDAISTHTGEEVEAVIEGTKGKKLETQTQESRQTRDENRAVRSGKVAPSRTFTVSGTPTNIKTREPKHEVDIDLLHELKSFSESTKSALGALGWGKLNRDGSKQKLRKRQPKLDDFVDEKKSGYQTEEGNNQLGGQAVPTEKEKLTSSLGAQNKQRKVTIRTER